MRPLHLATACLDCLDAGRGRGRGGRGGGQGGGSGPGIEAFYSPSMLENPWEALERRLLPQNGQQASTPDEQGCLDPEGAADRPWH